MLKKLDGLLQRYRFLTEKLSSSETLADMDTWRKYSKEQSWSFSNADTIFMMTARVINPRR